MQPEACKRQIAAFLSSRVKGNFYARFRTRGEKWQHSPRLFYYALRELKDWMASRKCPIDRCSLESEYIMAADYPFPSYHQQQNNLPLAKKKFPQFKTVQSQVLQTNIRRLHDSWDNFRERGYGFPRFKKYGQLKSILFPQFKTNPLLDTIAHEGKPRRVLSDKGVPPACSFPLKSRRPKTALCR